MKYVLNILYEHFATSKIKRRQQITQIKDCDTAVSLKIVIGTLSPSPVKDTTPSIGNGAYTSSSDLLDTESNSDRTRRFDQSDFAVLQASSPYAILFCNNMSSFLTIKHNELSLVPRSSMVGFPSALLETPAPQRLLNLL